MSLRVATKKIKKARIYRAVASSIAIETGQSVASIERQLKNKTSKFQSLSLAQ